MAFLARESTHRNYIFVLLITLNIAASLVACTQEICFQQKCFEGVDDVITAGISRKSCLDECRARDWCVGVSYHVPTQFCMVHSASATERPATDCEGFCYSEKALWLEPTLMCEDAECDQNKATCAAGQPCRYQDCPVPTQSNGPLALLGNLRSVGTKVAYMCSGNSVLNGQKSLTCLSGGAWSGTFPTCGPASTGATTAAAASSPSTTPTTTTAASTASMSTPTTTTTTAMPPASSSATSTAASSTVTTVSTTSTTATSPTPTTTTQPTTTTTPTTTPTTTVPTTTTVTIAPPSTPDFSGIQVLSCGSGWTEFQGSLYCFLTSVGAMSAYSFAKTNCGWEDAAATVVVPNTYVENELIKSQIATQPAGQDYWVGVEQVTAGEWQFSDGTTPPYTDWAPGVVFEPAIVCAKYESNSRQWVPHECSSVSPPYPYVLCEIPAP